jgi:hypothetical protein
VEIIFSLDRFPFVLVIERVVRFGRASLSQRPALWQQKTESRKQKAEGSKRWIAGWS